MARSVDVEHQATRWNVGEDRPADRLEDLSVEFNGNRARGELRGVEIRSPGSELDVAEVVDGEDLGLHPSGRHVHRRLWKRHEAVSRRAQVRQRRTGRNV